MRLIVLAILFGLGGFIPSALATELSVSPMSQSIDMRDESEIMTEVSVANATPVSLSFEVRAYDFGSLDQSGGVAFLGVTSNLASEYRLAHWMKLDRERLVVAPGTTETVRVTIMNGEDLAPGGHYGALVFQSTNGTETVESIAIQQMLASLLFINKVGGSNPALTLGTLDRVGSLTRLLSVQLGFRNTGNVHVTPRGFVQLFDPLGVVKARGIINEASALILPGTVRPMAVALIPLGKLWLPGWYKIGVSYRFDGKETFVSTHEDVFIIPWIGMALLIVPGGIIGSILFWRWKQRAPGN